MLKEIDRASRYLVNAENGLMLPRGQSPKEFFADTAFKDHAVSSHQFYTSISDLSDYLGQQEQNGNAEPDAQASEKAQRAWLFLQDNAASILETVDRELESVGQNDPAYAVLMQYRGLVNSYAEAAEMHASVQYASGIRTEIENDLKAADRAPADLAYCESAFKAAGENEKNVSPAVMSYLRFAAEGTKSLNVTAELERLRTSCEASRKGMSEDLKKKADTLPTLQSVEEAIAAEKKNEPPVPDDPASVFPDLQSTIREYLKAHGLSGDVADNLSDSVAAIAKDKVNGVRREMSIGDRIASLAMNDPAAEGLNVRQLKELTSRCEAAAARHAELTAGGKDKKAEFEKQQAERLADLERIRSLRLDEAKQSLLVNQFGRQLSVPRANQAELYWMQKTDGVRNQLKTMSAREAMKEGKSESAEFAAFKRSMERAVTGGSLSGLLDNAGEYIASMTENGAEPASAQDKLRVGLARAAVTLVMPTIDNRKALDEVMNGIRYPAPVKVGVRLPAAAAEAAPAQQKESPAAAEQKTEAQPETAKQTEVGTGSAEKTAKSEKTAPDGQKEYPKKLKITDEMLLAKLRESYGKKKIPEQLEQNIRIMYRNAKAGFADLNLKCGQNMPFKGGDQVKDLINYALLCRIVIKGNIPKNTLVLYSDPNCVKLTRMLTGSSKEMVYMTEYPHDAKYWREHLFTREGLREATNVYHEEMLAGYAKDRKQAYIDARAEAKARYEMEKSPNLTVTKAAKLAKQANVKSALTP